ncbi:ribose-5-phosphate isomerase [Trichococcus patagoniensis]|uniref:Ribose-5-phosphate isomerase n=1 Tax=Trichococcus patagoniensis TaxID=382641 RepID=A0A2T5IJF5_9LACT|nr:ribose 5-phosphate isomerase B [Trichococcus patagoniensis]PTQ83963.1 ribose-5-phosphate isomerase [Trichococcus patagoniensis]
MKIAIASDHGGYELKQAIISHLSDKGFEISDFGVDTSAVSVDYPHYAKKVAHAIINNEATSGILVCGTGIGMSIAANKVPGIRAAVVGDVFSARATKEHNNANIICLGQRVLGEGTALMIVDEWLSSDFLGDRHQTRIDLIEEV